MVMLFLMTSMIKIFTNYKMLEDPSVLKKAEAVFRTERFEKEYAGLIVLQEPFGNVFF